MRGVLMDDACPGCGAAASASLRRFVVDPRNRSDARRFQRGVYVLIWAGAAAVLGPLAYVMNVVMWTAHWPSEARVALAIFDSVAPIGLLAFGLDAATRRTGRSLRGPDESKARSSRIVGWAAFGTAVSWGGLVGSELPRVVWFALWVSIFLLCGIAILRAGGRIRASLAGMALEAAGKRAFWCSHLVAAGCICGAVEYAVLLVGVDEGRGFTNRGLMFYVALVMRMSFAFAILIGTVVTVSVYLPLRQRLRRWP